MTDAETRVLGRTAAVLLVVSLARYGWEARRPPPELAGGGDDGPELLAESRRLQAEERARSRPLGADEKIDANRVTALELDRLPGIGPAAARAIVTARERAGGFSSLDELLDVPGIGGATLARARAHLELSPRPGGPRRASGPPLPARPALPAGARPGALAAAPPGARATGAFPRPSSPRPSPHPGPPLDVNRATADDLERLPGVGPALAGRILEQRARLGRFGSLDELLEVRGVGPKTLERLRPLLTVGPG